MAAGFPSVSFSEPPPGTATRAEDSGSLARFWCGISLCPWDWQRFPRQLTPGAPSLGGSLALPPTGINSPS